MEFQEEKCGTILNIALQSSKTKAEADLAIEGPEDEVWVEPD